jgi:hypothetical protein
MPQGNIMSEKIRLYRKQDLVYAHCEGKDDMAVSIIRIRPLSNRDGEISLLGEKEEFAQVDSLEFLDPESKKIAEEELEKHYIAPEIKRVIKTGAHFGTRYLEVETDRGVRSFTMKNPYINIRWIGDEVIVRDVIGNTFRIPSWTALDEKSRAEIEKIT